MYIVFQHDENIERFSHFYVLKHSCSSLPEFPNNGICLCFKLASRSRKKKTPPGYRYIERSLWVSCLFCLGGKWETLNCRFLIFHNTL